MGYESTVLPALENALLAGHDVIFLGERGQAKTRIMRGLADLLDEWLPVVAGSRSARRPLPPHLALRARAGGHQGRRVPRSIGCGRDQRFGEKLATPDTSIADLIGEVDPVKVAEGRYLSDELTLHYGLVPRTNRGIFAINELPDLAERIQVGLLNVLEERDVQIRGYKIRLPLDILLVASANPEDYTSRGRIITPLKDRFGAQIRTHYPLDTATEMDVIVQEAVPADLEGLHGRRARLHGRDRCHPVPAGPSEPSSQPAVRGFGPPRRGQLRDPGGSGGSARPADSGKGGGAPGQRPERPGVLDGGEGRAGLVRRRRRR